MDAKLNHSDLSTLLAKEGNISTSKAEYFTKAFFDLIIEGLEQDGIVKINGLGTFKIAEVASRSSVDVNTGEKIEIKGHKKLTFTPADTLKESVNQPFAMFEPVEVDDTYQPENTDEAFDEAEQPIEESLSPTAAKAEEEPSMTTEPEMETTANIPAEAEMGIPSTEHVSQEQGEETETAVATEVEELTGEEAAVEENDSTMPGEESGEQSVPETAPQEQNEEPIKVQERPAEPVMVHVPKKKTATKEQQHAPAKKRNNTWRIAFYTIIGFITGFVAIKMMSRESATVVDNKTQTPVASEYSTPNAAVNSTINNNSAVKSVAIEEQEPVNETPQNVVVAENVANEELPTNEEYNFVMLDELASTSLKEITLADTTLYIANGELVKHIIVADETLTKIAKRYYGDKKLWPYIVKYNNISNPNSLGSGDELLIPRLEPKK